MMFHTETHSYKKQVNIRYRYMGVLKTISLIAFAISISACDSQIKKFVEGAVPKQNSELTQSSSQVGIKLSPGRLEASSADISAEANITPTRQVMTSTDISVHVGVSRTRVTQ